MPRGLLHLIKRAFGRSEPLHPVDRRMAKQWIKQRLTVVFPELRNDPAALERAYQALGLEPRAGSSEGDSDTVFEVQLPTGREPDR
jgi:hypothetical protein